MNLVLTKEEAFELLEVLELSQEEHEVLLQKVLDLIYGSAIRSPVALELTLVTP